MGKVSRGLLDTIAGVQDGGIELLVGRDEELLQWEVRGDR